ncbi:hypothetical protein HS088_TW22G01447 [Tripterygium wilfordii]|uniref:Uncharacterized protein n=1 Tax=Tripterygium wilfordii TaxID=458696 RepID=A0A7J7C0R7_TRIWF|nr:uncharacterized protein LOC119991217 [Tripterygium wilfordii]XP_038693426.1 uncharacterized protein LOC119991217 [Tripterygium wilfordii]KAF5727750.1 hypothetical protein HS088_TW22G01447 [Tripterygium wilfordii]
MNHCAIQQNACATREDYRGSMASVVCPKPRRLGLLNASVTDHHTVRSLRWHRHQVELCDSKSGNDILDILAKGGHGVELSSPTQVVSSPPFFCGSPPSRVANPLIQDARFGDEKINPLLPLSVQSSPSSARNGGCIRANFESNPAVRIEGFDCLDRDRRNCRIPALA